MRWISFLMLFSLVVLCSCKSPKKEDIIGTWQSDDGASFHFCNDGTFSVKNMPKLILCDNGRDEKLFSGKGDWEIIYFESRWKIELRFSKCYDFPGGFACYLNIEENFNWGNSSWNLYFSCGDDLEDKYIFSRSK